MSDRVKNNPVEDMNMCKINCIFCNVQYFVYSHILKKVHLTQHLIYEMKTFINWEIGMIFIILNSASSKYNGGNLFGRGTLYSFEKLVYINPPNYIYNQL